MHPGRLSLKLAFYFLAQFSFRSFEVVTGMSADVRIERLQPFSSLLVGKNRRKRPPYENEANVSGGWISEHLAVTTGQCFQRKVKSETSYSKLEMSHFHTRHILRGLTSRLPLPLFPTGSTHDRNHQGVFPRLAF